MTHWDWIIVALFLLVSLAIGLAYTKKAQRSLNEFFLSGRNMSWWMLGTSMVATTFASDTPLAITEYVRTQGIWGNWFWWSTAFSHVLAALLFSRLWRRAGVLTDNELIELRYHGKRAAFLRGFKAVYFSTICNYIIMGWVTAAMSTVFSSMLDIPIALSVVLSMSVALLYSLFAGLWGVAATDVFQFVIAMAGCVIFAVLAADRAGGMDQVVLQLQAAGKDSVLSFFPSQAAPMEEWAAFVVYLTVWWWSSHHADGGGYIIQRMMSAKNEKHALVGTSWFALAHYVLRVWPWIVVALASLIILPQYIATTQQFFGSFPDWITRFVPQQWISDREAYPALMSVILPAGLKGLFVATFLAAFMSTIVTHVNWGASYMVNDVYKRFICRDKSERHYLRLSKLLSIFNMVIGGVVALFVQRITGAWELLLSLGAGVGAVLILRWFWWRINAWSEISAMIASLVITSGIYLRDWITGESTPFYLKALIVVCGSISVWLSVTLLTRPEPEEVLKKFYSRIQPGGWWPFAHEKSHFGRKIIVAWIGGVAFIYGSMFFLGSLVMGRSDQFAWEIPLIGFGGLLLWVGLKRIFSSSTTASEGNISKKSL